MAEITLDEVLLRQMEGYCGSQYKHILAVIYDKVGGSHNSSQRAQFARQRALDFGATYHAMLAKFPRRSAAVASVNLATILATYVACERVIQGSEQPAGAVLEHKISNRRTANLREIDFSQTDSVVLDAILQSYLSFLSSGSSTEEVTTFFHELRSRSINELNSPSYERWRSDLQTLEIKSSSFQVKGLKGRGIRKKASPAPQPGEVEDSFRRDFSQLVIAPHNCVLREDIISNTEAIDKIQDAVMKLLTYRKEEKMNPFLDGRKKKGFTQGILFFGDTGSGKTMTAFYGMSLAQELAKEYGKEICFAEFNIKSGYQEGGVQMIRHQFNLISRGDRLYYLFVDELDTEFAARNTSENDNMYHKQKLGELLRFLDGVYPNYGNYLLVGTANDMRNVDKALKMARLERVYCPGARTAEEKAEVLKVCFGEDISNGLVKVQDWKKIGELASSYDLDGRILREVAGSCYPKANALTRKQYGSIQYAATGQKSQELITQYTEPITEEVIMRQLEVYARKDSDEKIAQAAFHS